ncbi:MAG: PDZ domain-containing protein [Lachnospiraceae bacterium]|jgi:serine protease Do|nr:PDZ domain-containing protein [Lachnospiraceae bacterium]
MENETNNNEVVADVTESVVETTSKSQTEGSTESTSYQSNNYQSTYNYGQNNYTGNNYGGTTTAQQPKKKKEKKKGSGNGIKVLAFVGKAAAFGIIAGGIMVGVNAIGNKTVNKTTKTAEVKTVTTADAGMKDNKTESDVADVAEEVMPSIVSITNTSVQVVRSWFQSYEQEVQGAGSGIIIGKTDDEILVATNNHVIDGAKELTVSFSDDTAVEAKVKGVDEAMDLAVVAIDIDDMEEGTLDKIKVAALGSSDDLRVGEPAIAIGNALGYGQSVTVGYISALDREVDADGKKMKLLQTDAAINPGNSGGALLNGKGEVIGINTMKYVDSTVEGMGYAIPISKAIPIINDLMDEKVIKEDEQGYLGINGNNITDEYAEQFNMPNGVYVSKILEDSPADKCGLKAGDIITKFGDRDVSSMEELQSILSKKQAGEEVTMVVQRNNEKGEYKEITLTVTLGAKKDMPESDKKKEKKSTTEEIPSEDEDGYEEYNEGENGYQEVDPEDFFRQFEEYFNR